MNLKAKPARAPGFVVFRRLPSGQWKLLGEVSRKPGLTARVARSQAIVDASKGAAKAGQTYAAVLKSEWRLAMDWIPPKAK